MHKYLKVFALFILTTSFTASAEKKGHIGFTVDVSVDGYFSPTLSEVEVTEVVENSPAELAGIKAGQKILSIDGCKVPGCPAKKAKKLMARKSGDILPLLVNNADGKEVLVIIHVK